MSTDKIPITFYLDKDLGEWHKSLPENANRSKEINSLLRKALTNEGEVLGGALVPKVLIPAGGGADDAIDIAADDITCVDAGDLRRLIEDMASRTSLLEADISIYDGRFYDIEMRLDDPQCECAENHDSEGITRLSEQVDSYRNKVQRLEERFAEQEKHQLEQLGEVQKQMKELMEAQSKGEKR